MNKLQKIIVKLFKIPTFTAAPATIVFDFKPITLGASFVLHPAERDLIIEGLIGEDAIRERLLKSMEGELIHYLELECEKIIHFWAAQRTEENFVFLFLNHRAMKMKRKEKIDG